jgi:hypothetical protein
MKKVNEAKIIKEIKKIEKQLAKDGYHLTQKGLMTIIFNMINEQLEDNNGK